MLHVCALFYSRDLWVSALVVGGKKFDVLPVSLNWLFNLWPISDEHSMTVTTDETFVADDLERPRATLN